MLIVIVVLWTGPWSPIPGYTPFKLAVTAGSSINPGAKVAAAFNWAPGIGGSAIMVSWIVIAVLAGYVLIGYQLFAQPGIVASKRKGGTFPLV